VRELTIQEYRLIEGGISGRTVAAGARLLGRAFIGGVAIGSGVGAAIGVVMIAYDIYHSIN